MRRNFIIPAAAALALAAGLAGIKAVAQDNEERAASISHIMNGLTKPSMTKISVAGNRPPATDKEWRELEIAAAMLNETTFILMEGGRAKDEVWKNSLMEMRAATGAVVKAAAAKNIEEVKANSGRIGATCKACHDVHQTQ